MTDNPAATIYLHRPKLGKVSQVDDYGIIGVEIGDYPTLTVLLFEDAKAAETFAVNLHASVTNLTSAKDER